MISGEEVKEALQKKMICPTMRPAKDVAGIEFEFPVVNLEEKATDYAVCQRMAEAFVREFHFENVQRDEQGYLYLATEPVTKDSVSFDCSYNTLEFSFGVERDLNVLYQRFVTYYTFVQKHLLPEHHTLTGMGINPGWRVNRKDPVLNGRYRMLLHHLESYPRYPDALLFHRYPSYGLFCCASQVQLDASIENVVPMLNAFYQIEPLKALLFANSPFQPDAANDFALSRDYFWRQSLHGMNPHNVDMCRTVLHSTEEIVDYYASMSLYCLDRDGRYYNFRPTPLADYFSADSITGEYFENGAYHTDTFQPEISDLGCLRSFKFNDLTYRGTVECRSVCEQPVSSVMAPAAFQMGLYRKIPELCDMMESDHVLYQHGYDADELRRMSTRATIPAFLQRKEVSDLLIRVIELSEEGLRERNLGEEKFLQPLYRRAETLLSPAREMLQGLSEGKSIQDYIRLYAQL